MILRLYSVISLSLNGTEGVGGEIESSSFSQVVLNYIWDEGVNRKILRSRVGKQMETT